MENDKFTIIGKQVLAPNICKMRVKAPLIAEAALPGQFLIVRTGGLGERIPLTISDYDARQGTVDIVTQSVGASTRMINGLEVGQAFDDMAGPLGTPSEFTSMGEEALRGERFVFLAGGVGTAPVYPQAKWLHAHGAHVDVIIGARTAGLLIYTEELASVCDRLYLCTDDGSAGFHGVVTAQMEAVAAERGYTRVVAIGPMVMMKFATISARRLGLPVTVSLNTLMVDGTGMCGACRVSVGGKMKFACVDGPEFDGYEVDFDEAMRRQRQYPEEEKAALERYGR